MMLGREHNYYFLFSIDRIIHVREACCSFYVFLESFVTSWMSHCCVLGGILEGWPLLGRFITVPSFIHLKIMALTMVLWSPTAFEIAL